VLVVNIMLCIVLLCRTGTGTLAVELVVVVMFCIVLCIGQEQEQ